MIKWLEGEGSDKDVVISSRIRLARNIKDIRFPQLMGLEEAERVIDRVRIALSRASTLEKDFEFYRLADINPIVRNIYVEKHLISPGLLDKPKSSGFLLSKDQKSTIMLNEEDHIRMQVVLPGLNLEEAWDLCSKYDDILEEDIKFAFDEKLGYLTTCPTNVGTGMRASVMMHLPALVLTQQINRILQAVNQIGLTVRGLYGEGSNAMGNLFQISNQRTLGESEVEIVKKLRNIVGQIINKERRAREALASKKNLEMQDKIYRSLGILGSARLMSSKEAMRLLSDIKLGLEMDIIRDIKSDDVISLMLDIQPASIQERAPENASSQERDQMRAKIIRENLIKR